MDAGGAGHEAWGIVAEVGPSVDPMLLGLRVAALCDHAYAEYDLARASTLVALPPELEGRAFPGEAFGCAMNIFRRSGIRAGETVAVVGVGFLGAILVRLAKRAGAKVIALSRRAFALEVARKAGADALVPMNDHARVVREVGVRTESTLCDRVIEATGAQWPLDLAAELTRERGTLVIAGYHQDGPRQVNMQLWNWRGLDVINAHERDPRAYVRGMREAVAAVTSGVLDAESYVTHRFPLRELGRALDATADRPDGFLKAVVVP
jgi:threonine dehydrogenase-like Zn-dependent dehydrogenase